MGKDNFGWYVAIIVGLIAFTPLGASLGINLGAATPATGTTTTTITGGGGPVIDHITEDTTLTFVAVNKFLPTTKITADEGVKVFFENGEGLFDEGNKSLVSGTATATPKDKYKLYFGNNDESGAVYTQKIEGVVPDKGTLKLQGALVTIDEGVSMSWKDKYGSVGSTLTIGSDETYQAKIYLQVGADKGYGNKYTGGTNVMCFVGNRSTSPGYSSIKLSGAETAALPNSIANNITKGSATWCYQFPIMEDNAIYENTVEITSTGDITAGDNGNITIFIEDVGMTLNADTGEEIIGVQDEDGNVLGTTRADKINVLIA